VMDRTLCWKPRSTQGGSTRKEEDSFPRAQSPTFYCQNNIPCRV
jgi:hypothetical protein